ncbi:LysE family translocator [Marinospirillum insulare]|uniref:Amino acid efflux permease RhtB family protein n=1 Tax=Marinospirillum insulare TaxID=217169 RepID=A0ABQ6A1J5_9GAMM|nr:LysE family translocator [Marinospirillum insulare]GLR64786.1 amino acid efflux permease RhtB family protein [Marinospirillum insulare]
MTFNDWLSVAAFCFLGAISPGPSLAVILRHTLSGSRRNGMAAAVAHGAGVGIYALAVAMGLGHLIAQYPSAYQAMTYLGAAYLAWLAIQMLRTSTNNKTDDENQVIPSAKVASRDGFLIVFTNPQLIIMLAALFSQFIQPGQSYAIGFLLATTAWIIDTLWYLLVALGLSHSKVLPWLKTQTQWINLISAAILFLLVIRVLTL